MASVFIDMDAPEFCNVHLRSRGASGCTGERRGVWSNQAQRSVTPASSDVAIHVEDVDNPPPKRSGVRFASLYSTSEESVMFAIALSLQSSLSADR
jgi:hypothetical protein